MSYEGEFIDWKDFLVAHQNVISIRTARLLAGIVQLDIQDDYVMSKL